MERKGKLKRGALGVVALLVALIMVAQLFTPAVALAAVSDGDTRDNYQNVFQQGPSTRDSGRVWSDKSVYGETTNIDGTNFDLNEGENFNVAYSLIGLSEKITGKTDSALDVVFILDTSGSMKDKTSDRKTRINAAIEALNHSLDTLLTNNPNNRVGVATFATESEILMPLANYKSTVKEAWDEVVSGRWPWSPDQIIHHPATNDEFISFDGSDVTATWEGGSNSVKFAGGTNTQRGFATGMDMLVNAKETTATINGKTVQRVPIVVMLSDGASTYSIKSLKGNWWNPSGSKQGPGNAAYYGNGMLAMMTASYKKQAINAHYGVTGTSAEARVYTIGLGVGELKGDEKDLAQVTLNPTKHWDDRNGNINDNIRKKWTAYTKKGNESIKVSVDEGKNYTANHPSEGDITSLKYENGYYETSNAAELDQVFESIVDKITASVPDYPTDIKGASAATGGYVTYTDPIGEYMEVKDVKAIIHNGVKYKLTGTVETGFKGSGTIKDPVTGQDVSLEGLTVTITKDPSSGNQILVAKVPAVAIPLKINEVKLRKDGGVESNQTVANPTPLRVVYSVGMSDAAIDLKDVSTEYIDKNTEDNKVNFYSNLFTGNKDKNGKTVGNAKTEFTPAKDNPNYYFQQNVTIYHDKELTTPVKKTEKFDVGTKYYLGTPFYNGTTVEQAIVERTGDAIIDAYENGYLVDSNGNWVLKAETPRIYKIEHDLAITKTTNATGTAEMLYSSSVDKSGFTINKIQFRHGNNGKVQVETPGNLIIKKTVTSAEGAPAPDIAYKFDVTVEAKAGLTVIAKLTDAKGTITDKELIFDQKGKVTVELKDKESITIPNCVGDYTVSEQNPGEGFTVKTPNNAKGSFKGIDDITVEFTNDYKVTPLVVDQTEFGFPMTKTITGRPFKDTDKFTFTITGQDGVMPEKNEVTIDGKKLNGKSVTNVDFGKFTFTKPGTFDYIITEKDGTIPGITYDATKYKLTVVVNDDEHGNLRVASSTVTKDTGEGNGDNVVDNKMSFVNEYNAESASVNLTGKKIMVNKNLNDFAKDFGFKIKALTEGAPMPTNLSKNGTVQSLRVDGSISFNNIVFTTKDIGKTYEYVITEIQPTIDGEYGSTGLEGAVKDKEGNWMYKGITFDRSKKTISIAVTTSDEGEVATIVATPEGNNFEFTNTYNADGEYNFTNAKGGEVGIKNITGRKFNSNDEFTFDVTSEVNEGEISKEATLPSEVKIKPADGNQFKFDFGSLKFTEEDAGKIFTYTFKERVENLGGITYDKSVKVVKLEVIDNNDGTLNVIRTGDKLEWTNKYNARMKDGLSLSGKKELSGKDLPRGAFTFTVQGLDGAPLKGGTEYNNNTVKNTNGSAGLNDEFWILNNQIYEMEDLNGQPEKTFVYEIKEVKTVPTPAGMNYDDSVFHVNVTVTDTQDGKLAVLRDSVNITKLNPDTGKFDDVDIVKFKNVYHPEEREVIPFVEGNSLLKKQLIGPRKDNLKAGEFKFKFALKSATPENGVVIENEGVVGNKVPDKNSPNLADVTFENSKITFKEVGTYVFTVEELPTEVAGVTNTVPEIEITYNVVDKDGRLVATPEFTGTVGKGVFVNEYKTSGKIDGKTTLEVEKILTGRDDNNSWTDKDSFKFNLEANDEITSKAIKSGYIKLTSNDITINSTTPDHKAAFGDIEITYPGTYTFKIFENATELQPGVHPDSVNRILTVTASDNGDGTLAITSNIKADVSAAMLTGEKDNLVFTNEYKPEEAILSGQTNLNVTKKLVGRDWLENDEFTFTLEAGDEETKTALAEDKVILGKDELSDSKTITINSKSVNNSANFGNIIFKDRGTYTFNITETEPNAPNIDYEKEPKKVVVDVVLNEDGTLTAALSRTSEVLTFVNNYVPTPGTLDGSENLAVTKEISGRDWLDGETFEFELTAANDAAKDPTKVVLPENTVITVDGETKTNHFGDITFKEKGTYEFDIVEKIPEDVVDGENGLTYDKFAKKVVVNVVDNNDGTLTVTKNEKSSGTLAFTNTYVPTPLTYKGETNLKVQKNINGRDWLAGDKFTFTLDYDHRDADTETAYRAGNFILPISKTLDIEYVEGKNDEYVANFGNIVFKKAGVYKFTIAENKGEIPGITYDNTVKNITVTVTDDGKGNLTATENGLSTFTNTYDPEDVVVGPNEDTSIQLKKVLRGRTLTEEDKWTFTITADEGTPLPVKTEVTNDMEKVTFGDITYTKPGVYNYVITESGTVAGVTNDETAQSNVTVTVTYNNETGKLVAAVTYDKDTFTNRYNVTPEVLPGVTELEVKKELKGREWMKGDKFYFNIEAADEDTKAAVNANDIVLPEELEINSEDINADQYKVNHFGDITFKKAGTFKFNIQENAAPYIAGVTNDTTVKTLIVNVKDNHDGTLTVTKDAENSTELVFTNKYKPASVTLAAEDAFVFEKAFVGRQWSENDKFTFTLEAKDGTDIPMPEITEVTLTSKDVIDNRAAFDFGSITYTDENLKDARTKAFTYVVKEVVPEDTKEVTYDALERLVTITVTDDGTGQLKTNVAVEGEKVFTNTYGTSVKYGDAKGNTPTTITKVLKNHELADGQFTFTIKALDEDGTGRSAAKLNEVGGKDGVITVTNAPAKLEADGNAKWHTNPFDSMVFVNNAEKKEAGTYSYEITEKQETKPGYTYDTSTHKVTITVTYNEATGKLDVNTVGGNVVFNNKYEAAGTLGGNAEGAVKINATKTLNGREMVNGEFKFEVVNKNLPEGKEIVAEGTNNGTNAGSSVEFSEIKYSLKNIENSGYDSKEIVNGNAVYTYSYLVREGNVTDGITRETPSFNITVKVADDGNGNLVPEVKYPEKTGSLDFVNTYNADSVNINIAATKKLVTPEGALVTLEDIAGKYEFAIEAAGAQYTPLETEPEARVVPEEAVSDEIKEDTSVEDSLEEIGEELVANELSMELPVQTVSEEVTNEQPETYTVEAEKEVKEIENPLPANATATNDKVGNIKFAPITFDLTCLDGVQPEADGSRTIKFIYNVTERNTVDGITNDPNPKTFTVTVVDNGKGQISASVDNAELEKLVFENTYSFTPGTSSLTGSGQFNMIKNLEGRVLRDAEFKFELKDLEGNVVATGKNDENGTVAIGEVQFTKPGIYQYNLSEVNGGQKLDNGVKYDAAVYEVTATVTDLKNGTLNVEWAVKDVDKDIVFTNVYDPKATAVTLGANKILSGRTLKDGEFTFVLKDENGNELQTVKNDKNGRIRFDKIIYDKAGTWKYTIEEVKGTEENMKYDGTVYKFTVNIIDNGIGFLRSELINENGYVVFHNIYEKPAEPVKPEPSAPAKPTGLRKPKTGDTTDVTLWAVLMMLAAGTAVVVGKKRKNK